MTGTNVVQAILQGVKMRIGDSEVFMPAFGSAYSNTEVAALANYVIAHFGGKQGEVTPAAVAERRLAPSIATDSKGSLKTDGRS